MSLVPYMGNKCGTCYASPVAVTEFVSQISQTCQVKNNGPDGIR